MECFKFDTVAEAQEFLMQKNKEDQEKIYSMPFGTSEVIKRTKEEYNPKPAAKVLRINESKPWLCDLPEYISPITGKPVDGRTERREEMKRHGVREVDPSEFKVEYKNPRFIAKHGIKQ